MSTLLPYPMGAKPSSNTNSKGANKLLISYTQKGLLAKQQTVSSMTPDSFRGSWCVPAGVQRAGVMRADMKHSDATL